RALFGEAPPVRTVYNAINLARFSPGGPGMDLDALSGFVEPASGTVRVGFLGTFARWKGQDVFLRALSKLNTSVPVRGYVIGGSIYETAGSQFSKKELREAAAACGVSDRVGFTGQIDDVPAALRSLDIVVHA